MSTEILKRLEVLIQTIYTLYNSFLYVQIPTLGDVHVQHIYTQFCDLESATKTDLY